MIISKIKEFLFPEPTWEELRCRECYKVMGEYKYLVSLPTPGQQGFIMVHGNVRCLECSAKDKE